MILGKEYSALDAYVFTLCRWTRNFQAARRATGRTWDLTCNA